MCFVELLRVVNKLQNTVRARKKKKKLHSKLLVCDTKTATERTQHRKWFDICTFSVCCKTEGRGKKRQISKATVAS